jgi:hypothetical protein
MLQLLVQHILVSPKYLRQLCIPNGTRVTYRLIAQTDGQGSEALMAVYLLGRSFFLLPFAFKLLVYVTSEVIRSSFGRYPKTFCYSNWILEYLHISISLPSQYQPRLIMYERDVITIVLSEPASESTTISPPSSLSTATVTNVDSTEGNYSLLQKYSPVYVAAAIVMICAFSLGLPSWLLLRYRRKRRTRQRSNDANNNHVISLRPSLPPRPTYNRSMASI